MQPLSNIASARVGGVMIGTDFQQNPIGEFRGRSMMQVPAGAPRATTVSADSASQSIGAKFKSAVGSLFSSIAGLLTPSEPKATVQAREDIKKVSAHIGDLLGAIAQDGATPPNEHFVSALLQELPSCAGPLASKMSYVPSADGQLHPPQGNWQMKMLVTERTLVHVKNMSQEQREALRIGLESMKNSSQLSAQSREDLASVSEGLHQFALREASAKMEGSLDLFMATAAQGALKHAPSSLKAFNSMVDIAKGVLKESGFAALAPKELQARAERLTLAVLEASFNAFLSPEDAGPMLKALASLPLDVHARLADYGARPFGETPVDNINMQLGAYAQTSVDNLCKDVEKLMDKVEAGGADAVTVSEIASAQTAMSMSQKLGATGTVLAVPLQRSSEALKQCLNAEALNPGSALVGMQSEAEVDELRTLAENVGASDMVKVLEQDLVAIRGETLDGAVDKLLGGGHSFPFESTEALEDLHAVLSAMQAYSSAVGAGAEGASEGMARMDRFLGQAMGGNGMNDIKDLSGTDLLKDLGGIAKLIPAQASVAQAIGHELALRKLEDAYSQRLDTGLQAASKGDVAGLLLQMDCASNSTVQARLTMNAQSVNGESSSLQVMQRVMEGRLDRLDDADLTKLAQQLAHPESRRLVALMQDDGIALLAAAADATFPSGQKGEQLLARANELVVLEESVNAMMLARGLTSARGGAATGVAAVKPEVVLQDVFQVKASGAGQAVSITGLQAGPPNLQVAWKANVDAVQLDIAANKSDYLPLNQLTTRGKEDSKASSDLLCGGFVKDMPRATYTFVDDAGGTRPLFTGKDEQTRVDQAEHNMLGLVEGNPAMVTALSRLSYQNIVAGFVLGLKDGGVLKLPNGTSVFPSDSGESRFHFSRNASGGVDVRIEYEIKNLSGVSEHIGENPMALDADKSTLYLGCAYRVKSDGSFEQLTPLQTRGVVTLPT